jgi:thioredoxin 2
MSNTIVACGGCGRRNRVPATANGVPRCAQCHQPLPWLVDADDGSFAAATGGTVPVLVDLWAPWCGPCRVVGPAVEAVTTRFAGRMKTVKVNVDEAPAVASRFGVRGVPTLLLLDGGRETGRQVGALPGADLERWVEGHLAQVPA